MEYTTLKYKSASALAIKLNKMSKTKKTTFLSSTTDMEDIIVALIRVEDKI